MYDIAIIGAGVVGAMTARLLAKYNLRICVLEKENDVACGATKANSAIVHAGFDAKYGSMMAKLNVQGSKMMEKIAGELDVKYKKCGSLVLGFSEEDRENIQKLYENGVKNGVEELEIIDREKLVHLEPNVSDEALFALFAPTGAIVCPYELTIAAIGNAMDNGADLLRNFEVVSIEKEDNYKLFSADGQCAEARYIVNAAGLYADKIAGMLGDNSFKIHPRRGEYILLDKSCGTHVSHTIFQTPDKMGKGVLVTQTVDGNLLLGPTSVDFEDKEDKSTTTEGFEKIRRSASKGIKNIPYNKAITSFCGLRAAGNTGDFIINSPSPGFINAAGIESPGLSASPAIALEIKDLLQKSGLEFSEKEGWIKLRTSPCFFKEASREEQNEIIKKDGSFGRIICRCEGVSEGEILYAIRQNPRPLDLDGVKRRTRAQMGRCQGGFCSPYITELLSKELDIPFEKVTKSGKGSYINISKTKEVR